MRFSFFLSRIQTKAFFGIIFLVTIGLVGCQNLKMATNSQLPAPKVPVSGQNIGAPTNNSAGSSSLRIPSLSKRIKFGQPVSMAVIWKDADYTAPGAAPTRGFGGRVYFYDKAGQPIRVDGDLSIYGFDDTSETYDRKAPDKKFEFRRSEFQAHHSDGDLGPSYSVWIPWDAIGGERKTISLLPIFRTASGGLCRGSLDVVVLPGRRSHNESHESDKQLRDAILGSGTLPIHHRQYSTNSVDYHQQHTEATARLQNQMTGATANPIRRVSHESTSNPPTTPPSTTTRTTTIPIPRPMAQRLGKTATQNPEPRTQNPEP